MDTNSYKAEVSNVAEQLRIWSESGSRPDEWLLREWAQRLKVVSDGLDGPSLPELKESLDFNRLYAGDHRALYADHQAHFDAHYDALKAAEFVTWMEGHAPHTLKNLLKMYKRSDATGTP